VTTTLGPGEYGDILIGQRATLLLTGGVYHVRSIAPAAPVSDDCPFPCRSLRFGGPSDVRVAGTVGFGPKST
jgi:hypothetical protein